MTKDSTRFEALVTSLAPCGHQLCLVPVGVHRPSLGMLVDCPGEFPQVHISCFRVIPKGASRKWRLIADMSSPEGCTVNDGIKEAICSLSYVDVNTAAHVVVVRG